MAFLLTLVCRLSLARLNFSASYPLASTTPLSATQALSDWLSTRFSVPLFLSACLLYHGKYTLSSVFLKYFMNIYHCFVHTYFKGKT